MHARQRGIKLFFFAKALGDEFRDTAKRRLRIHPFGFDGEFRPRIRSKHHQPQKRAPGNRPHMLHAVFSRERLKAAHLDIAMEMLDCFYKARCGPCMQALFIANSHMKGMAHRKGA